MRILTKIYAAMLATGALGLWSCSSDDAAMPDPGKGASGAGETVFLTVTASREGDAATRTIMSPDEEGKNLNCAWTDGDKLLVTDESGSRKGVLLLTGGVGTDRGTFTGEISVSGIAKNEEGKVTLHFFYLGTALSEDLAAETEPKGWSDKAKTYTVDYSEQPGTLASLTDKDLLTASESVAISEAGNGKGNLSATADFTMKRQISFAKFKIDLPEDAEVADGGVEVLVSGSGLNTQAVVKANTLGATYSQKTELNMASAVTVKANKDGEIYMVLLPNSSTSNPNFDLTFYVYTGNKTYIGTYGVTKEIVAEKYYRKSTTGESGTSYDALPVPMEPEFDPDLYPDYADEDPRNPLHRFAKQNLEREGDASEWKNVFASEPETPGALYQWGRNYGYMNSKGIYEGNTKPETGDSWGVADAYTNYLDAMGGIDYTETDGLYGILDYYVYNTAFSAYYGQSAITSGTGMHFNSNYNRFYDMPKIYNTVEFIKENPTKYFMDGRAGSKLRGYGSYYAGVDEMDNNPDYWVSAFGEGGSTWYERASKCGYDSSNPCPDNWRLPTAAEMRAIAPEGSGINLDGGYLSSKLSNYSELRQTPQGIRYAIRWLYTGSEKEITIEAVVVDKSYTQTSQLTSLFWDQSVNNKVVRKFPFTGMIRPFIGESTGYALDPTWICRPLHNGLASLDFMPTHLPYYIYGPDEYTLMGPADEGNFNPGFGCYWVEEKDTAFKFATRDIASSLAYSCLMVESAEPVRGYAIRPVMGKPKTTTNK